MQSLFEYFGIVEQGIMFYTYLLGLVLKLIGELLALEDLLDLLFRVLVVDDRQGLCLVLPQQWIPQVLLQKLWYKDIVLLVTIRESEAIQVTDLFSDLVQTLILIAQLLTRSLTSPVPYRNLYLILYCKVYWPLVLVSLSLLPLLGLGHPFSIPLLNLIDLLDIGLYILLCLIDIF